MPELPDIDLYVHSLDARITGESLTGISVSKPFLVRSVEPPLAEANGRAVSGIRRIGKRIAIGLEGDYWLVIHLMVAGRLLWQTNDKTGARRNQLATFTFSSGNLVLTEAGSKKRASLYLVQGKQDLARHDPGGLEPLECSFDDFRQRLQSENRTVKRMLTTPAMFSGIGNAYSDEILHAARLSPFRQTGKLTDAELQQLFDAMQRVLTGWAKHLQEEADGDFPTKVTAFRADMAVHGKFGQPCPVCAAPVQRIRYKSTETNYCARCQTGNRILADRSLSRLLKNDWPDAL